MGMNPSLFKEVRLMYKVKVQMVLDEKPKYELVTNDVHNIAERIRRIDPNYFIVFNRRTHRYEVHNTENIGNTFCFLVPLGNSTSEHWNTAVRRE